MRKVFIKDISTKCDIHRTNKKQCESHFQTEFDSLNKSKTHQI